MISEKIKKENNFFIRKMKSADVEPLLESGFQFGKENLKITVVSKFAQYTGLSARQTKFVAYSVKDKKAIAFFSLTKHPFSIQSLRYVFTNPDFRRKGIATKLIFYALSYAKKEGAKKMFLTADPIGPVTDLYRRLGFFQIIKSQAVWGGAIPKEFNTLNTNILIPLNLKSTKNLNLLFDIYRKCVGANWLSFFENNVNNFVYGYSQEFKNFFKKTAYVSCENNSFVMLYTRPFGRIINAHLYITDDSEVKPLLNEIITLFKHKRAAYSKIIIFNVKNESSYNLLQKYKFYPYITIFLGKNLVSL